MENVIILGIIKTIEEEIEKFEMEVRKGGYSSDFYYGWKLAQQSTLLFLQGLLK